MKNRNFPQLDPSGADDTRKALHAYSRVLGAWLKSCRPKRKHWWHASLRPSLAGLTTGVVGAGTSFELQLDLRDNMLLGRILEGAQLTEPLHGQPAATIAEKIRDFLTANGIDSRFVPAGGHLGDEEFAGYSADSVQDLAQALNSVSVAMAEFRAGIREETSPIQLWPHHFDLSMLWLPGEKIPGQDPENEEYSDKQMNFGFAFGDAGIPEPYFYITAYPLPDEFPDLVLPTGTTWQSDPFSGAVLTYKTLLESSDPNGYLLDLWNSLLLAGRKHMLSATS